MNKGIRFLLLSVLFTLGTSSHAIVPHLDSIDTPTAVTLPRGAYDVSFFGYGEGGVLTKASIGLHEKIFLGMSFDARRVIGDGEVEPNIPGVTARIKFTDGLPQFPVLVAIGYDSLYSGKAARVGEEYYDDLNPYNRVMYGPYMVVTKPIFLFNAEQHISFGTRIPVQPVYLPSDTSVFMAFDFPLGDFVPMIEVQRLYFDTKRLSQVMFNFGFRYNMISNLALELNFMTGPDMLPNRMVVLQYIDRF